MKKIILFILVGTVFPVFSQSWDNISASLYQTIPNFRSGEDRLNRNIGNLTVLPSGELIAVMNGTYGIYASSDQGDSWRKLDVYIQGRSYGAFSVNLDYNTSRYAVFMIVQQKQAPAVGAVMSRDGKVLSTIGKPDSTHDGWTWGMVDWTSDQSITILDKEHHAWVIMWSSRDAGQTWRKLDFQSRNPGLLNDSTLVAGNDDGIYRSMDSGASWVKVSDFIVTGKTPVRYGEKYYWTTAHGVIVTGDHGATWNLLGTRLPDALYGPYFGKNKNQLMVVSREGFFITKNGGTTWEKKAEYFVDPNDPESGHYNIMHPTNSYGGMLIAIFFMLPF